MAVGEEQAAPIHEEARAQVVDRVHLAGPQGVQGYWPRAPPGLAALVQHVAERAALVVHEHEGALDQADAGAVVADDPLGRGLLRLQAGEPLAGGPEVAAHGLHLPGLGLGQAPVQLLLAPLELAGFVASGSPLLFEATAFLFDARPKKALLVLRRLYRFLEPPELEPQLVGLPGSEDARAQTPPPPSPRT